MNKAPAKRSILCVDLGNDIKEEILLSETEDSDGKCERGNLTKPKKIISHSRKNNISRLGESVSDSEITPKDAGVINEILPAEKDGQDSDLKQSWFTPLKAIKKHCKECAGDSPKEVTLCQIVDCPLWPFRFGCSMKSAKYHMRMLSAKKNHSAEYREFMISAAEYLETMPNSPEKAQISTLFREDPRSLDEVIGEG